MNIETVREYCLSLPHTTEDMAFGDDILLIRVCDRIFACMNLEGDKYLTLKCNPDYAVELRDRWDDIAPAWHWNKKYWNQLRLAGNVPDELVMSLIRHSYSEVVAKLPRRLVRELPELLAVRG